MSDQSAAALKHIIAELGADSIERSLSVEYVLLQKAHDAVHEFMFLAPQLCQGGANGSNWRRKAAFLIYQWECFDIAHRSVIEALCAHYNAAFILLRATLETILKGALWQCLSQAGYRAEAEVLRREAGRRFRIWLNSPLSAAARENSAVLFDEIEESLAKGKFAPRTPTIIRQLAHWGILGPIPDPVAVLYDGVFSMLSADVHVAPNTTSVGRSIETNAADIFECRVQPEPLVKHARLMHQIMDSSITIELNVPCEGPPNRQERRRVLNERLPVIEPLGLKYSASMIRELANV